MNTKAATGTHGEDIAIEYLRQKGYLICNRNWRSGRYEIDIIATKYEVTHIIEVRTRKAGAIISPEKSISASKVSALRRAAAAYLRQNNIRGEVEFDLIAIDMFPDGSYDIRFFHNIAVLVW